MKSRTKTNILLGSGLALALALAVWSPAQAQSADTTGAAALTDVQMSKCCQDIKDAKQKMKDEVKADDARLSEQLAQMDAATDDKKLAQISAVVTLLVEQRISMNARRCKMDDAMTQHMMQHMQANKDALSKCSMMKCSDDKSAAPGAQK